MVERPEESNQNNLLRREQSEYSNHKNLLRQMANSNQHYLNPQECVWKSENNKNRLQF